MKIQLASDLHLEFLQRQWPGERIITPHPEADALVLAGDIASGASAVDFFSEWPVPVIYVIGNHELYHFDYPSKLQQIRELSALRGIHFLENDTVTLGGVRFIGATLWTDYKLDMKADRKKSLQSKNMRAAEISLNDHTLIKSGQTRFKATDALQRHLDSRAYIESELAKPFAGKTVLVTHHGVHPKSIDPKYFGSDVNSAFVSDMTDILLRGVDLSVHGHVHDGVDYRVGDCRVVANPAGYLLNRNYAPKRENFEFENARFNPQLVIEV